MKRKLILGERIMYVDAVTPLNCVFTARIKGSFTPQEIRKALLKVQQKHPLLRAYLEEDQQGIPYFVYPDRIQEIPLRIVQRTGNEQWIAETETEWALGFAWGREPLFRVVWLKAADVNELLLVFAHCIGDGSSFVAIMTELLWVLDDPLKDLGSYLPYADIQELLPAGMSRPVIKGNVFAVAARLFFLFKRMKPKCPPGKSYMLSWKLGAELTAGLAAQCKLNGVTVHAALCIAFMDAYRQVQGSRSKGKVICPADIRKFLSSVKVDMLFAFAPVIELRLPEGPGMDFWSKAIALKQLMGRKLESMNIAELLVMSEFFHGTVSRMIRYLRATEGGHDITLSNMGRLSIPEAFRNFEVETVYSPNVAFPWRNPSTVVISTYKGEMDFAFCSADGFLPRGQAQLIREAFNAVVETLACQVEKT